MTTLLVVTADRAYDVVSDLAPAKWLQQVQATEREGVVFVSFDRVTGYNRHGNVEASSPVLVRLDAIHAIQVADR